MKRTKVSVVNIPLEKVLFLALAKPYANEGIMDKPIEERRDLVKKICIENKHESVLEHLVFTFEINGISRACLQELARHRIASYTVESTRFALKKIVKMLDLDAFSSDEEKRHHLSKFFVYPRETNEEFNKRLDENNLKCIKAVKKAFEFEKGHKNDEVKYLLNESFRTDLVMTINARSLRNLFILRSSENAHFEIRGLTKKIYNAIIIANMDLHYLFDDVFVE